MLSISASVCLDDSFAHSCQCTGQLHELVLDFWTSLCTYQLCKWQNSATALVVLWQEHSAKRNTVDLNCKARQRFVCVPWDFVTS